AKNGPISSDYILLTSGCQDSRSNDCQILRYSAVMEPRYCSEPNLMNIEYQQWHFERYSLDQSALYYRDGADLCQVFDLALTRELPENWTDTRETLLEGMVFQLKYLGVTLVEQPKGEELSAAAVKRVVATAKASGKKLQKVTLKVSPRGIILYDSASNQLIENVSIYRISYCTADKMHDKVFAYIAQSQRNETLECHAFLCTKKKVAQAVTLTVAQAFKVAFEFWQNAKEEKEKRVKVDAVGPSNSEQTTESVEEGEVATGNLLNLEESAVIHSGPGDDAHTAQSISTENNNTLWELDDGLDEAFS
ncbi:low density lipoprotein receptor adapter protein 1 isoform X2, partial [Clarias magur]